ncbi:hypothetical protein HDU86_007985 [Geranomyces michiganensis]|nr:hypothetical protein HDU86_007985 [Geranomyces michiganensis]
MRATTLLFLVLSTAVIADPRQGRGGGGGGGGGDDDNIGGIGQIPVVAPAQPVPVPVQQPAPVPAPPVQQPAPVVAPPVVQPAPPVSQPAAPVIPPQSLTQQTNGGTTCNIDLWTKVRDAIHREFGPGPCGAVARAAVRLAFHDAGTYNKNDKSGGPNGSILRFSDEALATQNNYLNSVIEAMQRVFSQFEAFGVTRADIVQLAGVLGVVRCPGGPSIPFSIGRKDSTTMDSAALLPGENDAAAALIARYDRMGFTASETIALIGRHTCAKQYTQSPRAQLIDQNGFSLDSTPELWDTAFYAEIKKQAGFGQTRRAADVNLANYQPTAAEFASFATNQQLWNTKFTAAWTKMANLGYQQTSLFSCPIIPPTTPLTG